MAHDESAGDDDGEYRGILDEWAREQARERDRQPNQWDNEERGRATPGEARLERLQRESAVCTTHHAACACGQLAELRLMEMCQRLERENAALRTALQEIIDFAAHDVDPVEIARAALAVVREGGV